MVTMPETLVRLEEYNNRLYTIAIHIHIYSLTLSLSLRYSNVLVSLVHRINRTGNRTIPDTFRNNYEAKRQTSKYDHPRDRLINQSDSDDQ